MAIQTTTTLVDDIDGSEAADTYVFGLEGTWYEIDLNEDNAKKLEDALSGFMEKARRAEGDRRGSKGRNRPAKPGKTSGRLAPDREQTTAIRNWARSQGLTVSDRGRLSQAIIDQFQSAH